MKWFKKKPHVHTPIDPVGVALIRADNLRRGGGILNWRCRCGEWVIDEFNKS